MVTFQDDDEKDVVIPFQQSQTSLTGNADDTNTGMADDENEAVLREKRLQEVMEDNLEVMLAVIMKIREDEDFAKSIYADCPRLQHLLDQHPDLRPVFQDQNLIRFNFEQVYRKAGGILPEDHQSIWSKALKCIVNSHLFKIVRFLLLLKKLYSCIMGSGFVLIKSCLCAIFQEKAVDAVGDGIIDAATGGDGATGEGATGDGGGGGGHDVNNPDDYEGNPANQANREALNRAADYMESPDVQERMQVLLESDPEHLDEAIEHEPELKSLRDSNPLCAELMNDPETMKILVDPDNLRALGECPDLIELDFSDPDWGAPDVENGSFDDASAFDDGADEPRSVSAEADFGADEVGADEVGADEVGADEVGADEVGADEVEELGEAEVEAEVDDGAEEVDEEGEEEEEGGALDDYERGDETEKSAPNKKQQQKKKQEKKEGGEQSGGFLSTLGTGLVDFIAAETVGITTGELMGGGDDFGVEELEDQAAEVTEEVADGVADTADNAENLAATASALGELGELATNDDLAGNVEDYLDEVEGANDKSEDRAAAKTAAISGGAVGGGVAVAGGTGRAADSDDDEDVDADVEEVKKKGIFGRVGGTLGGGLSALSSATKEFAAGVILGDDLAEVFVEKIEEEDEEEEDEEGNDKKEKEEKEGKRSRSRKK